MPFPVDYKRGKRRKWDDDDVQLSAQAIRLEEVLGVAVPAGAIFHVKTKRRHDVPFTPLLRDKTRRAAERLHELLRQSVAPPPVLYEKCGQRFLRAVCLSELLSAPDAYRRAAESLFTT